MTTTMTLAQFMAEWHDAADTVTVHTSGSTGVPKLLRVEKRRMLASARATCDALGLRQGDSALLCMSLDYIAGKMMVVRALERGLRLVVTEPGGHPLAGVGEPIDFAAMVPLQVYNSLQVPQEAERLRRIRHLLIGGGPLNGELELRLRGLPNAVWHTYAMTETLSHIALRRVSGSGATPWFTPMQGIALSQTSDGCLVIDAPHLCPQTLVTHDVVELQVGQDGGGQRFKVLGRVDNVIISGGVKIHIEQVEEALARHLQVPFAITRKPDARLGECVVLMLQGGDAEAAVEVCRQALPRYWQPREVVQVERIPMTATGKPARALIEQLARDKLQAGWQ